MEAAPANTERSAPMLKYHDISVVAKDGIGDGKAATAVWVSAAAEAGEFDTAAQICDELVVNGFDDWFLPSKMELTLMYGNLHRKSLGGFSSVKYRSSSYDNPPWTRLNGTTVVNFADGNNTGDLGLDEQAKVRAIRQF
jgi:hypothetical protein